MGSFAGSLFLKDKYRDVEKGNKMKYGILTAMAFYAVSGCVQTLEEYRPVVDPSASNIGSYDKDLADCYSIAKRAEADYLKRQEAEMGANLIGGLLAGALVGAVVGDSSDWAKTGAVYGGVAGVASTDTEMAVGGPRRIIDRCMTERGHKIFSDLGKG